MKATQAALDAITATSWARLARLFGPLRTCTACGLPSIHPTHPNCETRP